MKVLPVLSAEWIVQLKLNISADHTTEYDWCNIVQVHQHGDPEELYGKRTPAVYYHRVFKKLQIDSAVNGNQKHREEYDLVLNTEYSVEIHQRYKSGGVYKYFILLKFKGL